MSSPADFAIPEISDLDMHFKVEEMKKEISRLEEAAANKDKHISQLTSRMREYEMGEYGLAEAVSEIKSCRKIIRARDKDVEALTDEINILKLKLADAIENNKSQILNAKEITSFLEHNQCFKEDNKHDIVIKKPKPNHLSKTSQCQLSVIPDQYLEDVYATHAQNEMLRLELTTICEKSMEFSKQIQNLNKQDEIKHQQVIVEIQQTLSKANGCRNQNVACAASTKCILESDFKHAADYFQVFQCDSPIENSQIQKQICDLIKQVHVLKNNQGILIRRYMLLSDKEAHLRKENVKLRKVIQAADLVKNDAHRVFSSDTYQSLIIKLPDADDSFFLKDNIKQANSICKDQYCQVYVTKLRTSMLDMCSEMSMLRRLLEIAHHQTQAVEAMWFTQEVEIKALREQFAFLQAQSDEKLLLGKLLIKVLQLQFNQAACIYELKKYKLNQKALEDWYATLTTEYEVNGKKFATLYLEAEGKVKHLHDVLKDLCHRSNEALSSYVKTEISEDVA